MTARPTTTTAARARAAASVVAVVLVTLLAWWLQDAAAPDPQGPESSVAGGTATDPSADPSRDPSADPSRDPSGGPATDPASGLPLVDLADLPPEAARTLELIAAGGPFPEPDRDGTTFQNRERLLPREPEGYYREYTVPTPGSSDRGARRIVTGEAGERYWTADHYESFALIVPDG